MIIPSNRHEVQTLVKSLFELKMILIIRRLKMEDEGSYYCNVKNSLGEANSRIRLYSEFDNYCIYLFNFILYQLHF